MVNPEFGIGFVPAQTNCLNTSIIWGGVDKQAASNLALWEKGLQDFRGHIQTTQELGSFLNIG
jgi:hypothetical protein